MLPLQLESVTALEAAVPEGVDAAVLAVQAAGGGALRHGGLAESERIQVGKGDDRVLGFRHLRDRHVARGLVTIVNLRLTNVLNPLHTAHLPWPRRGPEELCPVARGMG